MFVWRESKASSLNLIADRFGNINESLIRTLEILSAFTIKHKLITGNYARLSEREINDLMAGEMSFECT